MRAKRVVSGESLLERRGCEYLAIHTRAYSKPFRVPRSSQRRMRSSASTAGRALAAFSRRPSRVLQRSQTLPRRSNLVDVTVDYCEEDTAKRMWSVGVTSIVRITVNGESFHEDIGYSSLKAKEKGECLGRAKKAAVSAQHDRSD